MSAGPAQAAPVGGPKLTDIDPETLDLLTTHGLDHISHLPERLQRESDRIARRHDTRDVWKMSPRQKSPPPNQLEAVLCTSRTRLRAVGGAGPDPSLTKPKHMRSNASSGLASL